ncbi:ATP-binding cassette domain-containing protein, partial [Brucella sp. 21LCYQ03]|nr:ATP-binding cassette domain-containing protein [Brucella sp. 21LCYQ03]
MKILDLGDYLLPDGIVWLKGINGAGKSTLLSCAAGLLPFSGDIALRSTGQSLKKDSIEYRQKVSFSEADPIFPGFLTGKEIIAFFRAAKGGSKQQADDLIALFEANTFIHQVTATYSSGMNKKLSLILAFI